MRNTRFLAVSALALTLAACSGGEETASDPAESAEAPVAEATADAEPALEAPVAAEPTPEPEPSESAKAEPAEDKAAAKAAPAPEPTAKVVEVAAVSGPPKAFSRCAVCHNAEKGAPDKIGPNLWGVYGHPAGQGSYNFSTALKESGVILDDATLHAWLENPRKFVPGNRMSFPGLRDEAKRQEIIDYLKQQR